MDPRQRRSLERLTAAIYQLASGRSVESVTVSEVARTAGVDRSTFYRHADSPRDLLERVLTAELERVRAEHLLDVTDPPAAIAGVVAALLDHVQDHESVYRPTGAEVDPALRGMLGDRLRDWIEALIETGIIRPPGSDLESERMAASFVAFGTAGAVTSWLGQPAPRDRGAFLRAYRLVMPAWWPWHA